MKSLFFITLLTLASDAQAANQTYLQCSLDQDGKMLPVELTIDEPNQKVTLFLPTTGHTKMVTALFSPGEVKFVSDSDRYSSVAYFISRVDLSIKQTTKIGTRVRAFEGTCKIKPVPKRAF